MMLKEEPYVPPPGLLLAFSEAHRAALEMVLLGVSHSTLRKIAPKGDGHAVMVLPGFLGGDGYNSTLRRFLGKLNYSVHGWGLGRNLGPRDGVLEALEKRLLYLSDYYQGPVSLVGHSLGGIFARELARVYPDRVRQVISLGSPFGEGRLTGSIPARLFMALNPPDELPVDQDLLSHAPPVPTTAIYSKYDGIVNWQTTFQQNGHAKTQSIEVRSSHCGMTFNPSVWLLVAECLANDPASWQPFARGSWRRLLYPETQLHRA
jgi:pimeloyl-ACP methyl ester carboxylesterase